MDKQRGQIATAFEKHFRHFGFKKTTVDDVAADLGISKKTIYRCFTSKEEIFSFIISRKAESRRVMVEQKIRHLATASEKMESIIRINFEEYRKIRKKKVMISDERSSTEIAGRIFRKTFFTLLSDILQEGVDHDEFEVCEHETTVRYIQALISEAIMMVREDISYYPEENLICVVSKLLKKNI